MRTQKRYTNTTFTKRVDHIEGHQTRRAPAEPLLCESCGSIYKNRRWYNATRVKEKALEWKPAQRVTCPACLQAREGVPGGFLYLDGQFKNAHYEEVERLLLNEAKRAKSGNPLARILKIDKEDGERVTITTTTERLAQRLGHALEKAYGGEVRYGFSHENKLARIWWHRD